MSHKLRYIIHGVEYERASRVKDDSTNDLVTAVKFAEHLIKEGYSTDIIDTKMETPHKVISYTHEGTFVWSSPMHEKMYKEAQQ